MMNYKDMTEEEIVSSLNPEALGYGPYNDMKHPRTGWREFSQETASAVLAFFAELQAEDAETRRRITQIESELKSARWDDAEYNALEARLSELTKIQTWHICRPVWLDILTTKRHEDIRNAHERSAAEKYRYTGGSLRGMARERDRLND